MPDEAARLAGTPPRRHRAAAGNARAAPGSADASASSAQARWLSNARQQSVPDRPRWSARRSNSRARQAEPRHSGVEVQHRRQGLRAAASCCHSAIWPGSFSTGTRRAAANSSAEPGTGPLSTAISHGSERVSRKPMRLVEGRDKKAPASGRGQRARDGRRAQAVAVGLDHRGALRRSHPLRQKAPVRDNARDIDFEHRRCTVGRVGSHVRPRFRREGRSPI